MSINRLAHVVAVASQFSPDPSEPIAIHYWWCGLGGFFPMPYAPENPDHIPARHNLTECVWIVPGTIEL